MSKDKLFELDFDVKHEAAANAIYVDGIRKKTQILGSIVLFSISKLTGSSGKDFKMFENAHYFVCFMYKLTKISKDIGDFSRGFP